MNSDFISCIGYRLYLCSTCESIIEYDITSLFDKKRCNIIIAIQQIGLYPQNNLNIVESGIKHHKPTVSTNDCKVMMCTHPIGPFGSIVNQN
jgi:hypothetical protein